MSTRIQKVNELIRHELATIISREVEFKDTIVTVMRANTDADLKRTKVFVGVIPATHEKGALVTLKKRAPHLQRQLNRTLSMRFVPVLSFSIERGEKQNRGDEVEHILDQIKNDL